MNILTIIRKHSALLLGLMALFLVHPDSYGQSAAIKNYVMKSFSSGYTALSGATLLGSGDDNTYSFALPFNFNYDSVVYTSGSSIYANTNGIVKLGATIYCCEYSNYMGTTTYPSQMGIFQGDDYVNTGVYYQTAGSAPNRTLTIEFVALRSYSAGAAGKTTNMEVVLYETSNVIEFWYKDWSYQLYTGSYAGVGLNGATSPTSNWLIFQGTSGTTPSSNVRFTPPVPLPNVQLSTSPKTVDFGFGFTGTNVDKQITITHAGDAGVLNVTSSTLVGNPDFSIIGPLPTGLTPGQSVQLTVRFTAIADGARTATLTLVSNGRDSGTQSIFLTAKGVAPNILVDSTTLFKKTRTKLGDTLRQWIHITSVGQASLSFLSFPFSGVDADQYFVSRFPANPIAPGVTDSLQVSYVPTREGLRGATLTINNNSFNLPSLPIILKGTGILPHIVVTPTPLLFDSTAEGDTVCKTITIWNNGTDTLKIFKNILSSNDGDFHYTGISGKDTLIPPDHTQNVTICFVPRQQGIRQGRLTLQTNIIKTFETPRRDTASLVSIDFRGTGLPLGFFSNSLSGLPILDSAVVGTQVCRTDTIWNIGDADIMVTGITFAAPNASDFSQSGLTFPFLLKAHGFKTFTLCGTPSDKGLRTSMLTVTGTSGGRTLNLPIGLGVYGVNVCASPAPDALFLQTRVAKGMDSTVCDTITNCGEVATVYTSALNGADKDSYTVTPAQSGVVQPGATAVFCVTFHATATGKTNANLLVTAPNVKDMTIPLTAEAACAVLTHSAVQVPNTGAGGKQQFTFTIDNTGTGDWTPGTGVIAGTGGSSFTIDSIVPSPIPAGGQGKVYATFHPAVGSEGTDFTANLTFPNSGPCQDAAVSIDLFGKAVVSSVKETASADGFSLDQTYPNPSAGVTNFTYTTPREAAVRISVVDLTGKLVRTIVAGRVSEGMHSVNFDAKDMPSGTYVYVLESGSTRLVRQMILSK